MDTFELTDTKEKFELKINGNVIPNITGYKLETYHSHTNINLELSFPNRIVQIKKELAPTYRKEFCSEIRTKSNSRFWRGERFIDKRIL